MDASGQVEGTALRRLADELTATLAGLLGYIAVLAFLGVTVIQILEMDEISTGIGSVPASAWTTNERPPHDRIEGTERPQFRPSVAAH